MRLGMGVDVIAAAKIYCRNFERMNVGDIADMYDYYDPDFDDQVVTCKFCGWGDLEWGEVVKADGSPGWALFTPSGRRHRCDRSAKADEFEVLDAPAK